MSSAIFLDVASSSHLRPLYVVVPGRIRYQAERSPGGLWNASGRAVDDAVLSLFSIFYRLRRLAGSRLSSAPSSRSKSAISWKSL